MFDMMKLKDVLVSYKQNFVSKWWKMKSISGKLPSGFRTIGM